MAIINKTGIGAGNIIQPSHVTNLYDTFNGTGSFDVIATGSFNGTFVGDGSQLTGIVSSKWDGENPITRESNVEILGSLNIDGNITASGDIEILGSFIGDGSQLTGIASSNWTGSNPISRNSNVDITGSLRVSGSITGSLINGVIIQVVGTGKAANATIGAVSDNLYISSSDHIRLDAPTVRVEPIVNTFSLARLNSGSTAGNGFVLPTVRPTSPVTGSMHVSGSGADFTFYIYNGANWRSGSLS